METQEPTFRAFTEQSLQPRKRKSSGKYRLHTRNNLRQGQVRTGSRTTRRTMMKLAAKIIKKIWVRRTRRRRMTSNVRKQVGLS